MASFVYFGGSWWWVLDCSCPISPSLESYLINMILCKIRNLTNLIISSLKWFQIFALLSLPYLFSIFLAIIKCKITKTKSLSLRKNKTAWSKEDNKLKLNRSNKNRWSWCPLMISHKKIQTNMILMRSLLHQSSLFPPASRMNNSNS